MREGLRAVLERTGRYTVVVDVGDTAALQEALTDQPAPDLALVDVSDGTSDGFVALAWLQEQWPTVRCLAYGIPDHDGAIVRAYRRGARAMLSKHTNPALMVRALEAIHELGVFHTERTQQVLLENPEGLSPDERLRARVMAQLSERLLDALLRICHDPNPTYEAIAQDMGLSTRTVECYASRLFEIFGVHSKPALLKAAIRLGVVVV